MTEITPEALEALSKKATRNKLSHHEQMVDAQTQCVPCKLCGGRAVISDAGVGAGYYIACENGNKFKASEGCLINERRLGGWAYNVMEWWNRLHTRTGQLILAQPSGDATAAAFEVGQQTYERVGVTSAMREVMELFKSNRAATSQPSGDEVEAVARKFNLGDRVTKIKGSSWTGLVVGFYSTNLTPIGYAVESENEPGSVQIYPESALDAHRGKQACLKARENSDG